MAKIDRQNRRWNTDEESALLTMKKNGCSQSEMATALGRSVAGIRNRLDTLRRIDHSANGKLPTVDAKTTDVESDLSLLLWFVKEAWAEGHAIVIPSLGATFRKGG